MTARRTAYDSTTYDSPQAYDLIFMDIQMPDLDGVETTHELRRLFGADLPPVVAMTAYSMKEDRDRFLSQGLNDYVPKPIRAQALVLKVKEWMDAQGTPTARPRNEVKTKPEAPALIVPIFDTEVINQLKDLAGVEMVHSVFEDFEREATEQLAGADDAYHLGDHAAVESNLHTLKGNAGTLGLTRLHEAVKSLEEKTKVGNFRTFEREMPRILEEFKTFRRERLAFLDTL